VAGPARRRAWLAFAALAAAVAAALALAWASRAELAERFLLAQLAARGVEPAALRVSRLDASGLEVRGLALGAPEAPDLSAGRVELAWSLAGLRARRLDAVRVSELRLRGALAEGPPRFGALDPLLRGGGGAPGAPALPVRELEVRDATLALDTPHGEAHGAVDGRLLASADGALAGELALRVEHPLARASGTVALSGTLERLAAELALDVSDGREPARVAPATLRGSLAGSARALRFALALGGAEGRLGAAVAGDADLEARSARADLRLAPLAFEPRGLQPATLVPALEPLLAGLGVTSVSGRIEAHGELAVVAGAPALRVDVALRGIGFESRLARVAGASGVIALHGPPWQTPRRQRVSVALLDPGLPLTAGLVEFSLRRGGTLAVHRAAWQWAGGEVSAQDLAISLGSERGRARLQASGLDLAALLALVSLEGLEGSGRVDGELPIVRGGGQLRVDGGVLRAAPGGTLRYSPSESTRALAASRPGDLGIAVAALSDLRYQRLEARLDGDLRGEMQIGLHVSGANPSFRGGQPIELNLNLEARLADLVRTARAAYRVPQAIEDELRAFGREGKP
jgi:hypothetical protein